MKQLRRLLPAARPYWPAFTAGLACVLISNFFTTLGPLYLQEGIDALGAGGSMAEVRRALARLLGGGLLGGITRFGMRQTLNGVSRRIETDLRNRLYVHLQRDVRISRGRLHLPPSRGPKACGDPAIQPGLDYTRQPGPFVDRREG